MQENGGRRFVSLDGSALRALSMTDATVLDKLKAWGSRAEEATGKLS
jgi:hypothetical protein